MTLPLARILVVDVDEATEGQQRDLLEHGSERFELTVGPLDADGQPLLDTTVVMFGTGMGDASRHSNRDLPTIVAGGGLKHGQHVAADPKDARGEQLGDVFVSILKQLGSPVDSFSDAKRGIDAWA